MVSAEVQDFIILESKIKKQEEIAQGSFGIVYKGFMQGRIEVAIKELYNQSLSEAVKQDLEQELAIFQKLNHPNIVSLYGYCPQPLYLVMGYLHMNLYQLLHKEEELSWDLRYGISLDIVLGLDYIHQKSIIHRKLKSNNILLDEKLRVKITDFGLSRVRAESKSIKSKSQVSNYHWMAPELMKLKPNYSKQSDIFALGIIFWEIAARKVPHSEIEDLEIREKIIQGKREDIPEDCPSDYRNLIEKCWQQDPQDRETLEFLQKSLENLIQPKIQPEMQSEIQPEIQPEMQSEIQSEIQPEIQSEIQPEIQPKIQSEINIKIILDQVFKGHTTGIYSLVISTDQK